VSIQGQNSPKIGEIFRESPQKQAEFRPVAVILCCYNINSRVWQDALPSAGCGHIHAAFIIPGEYRYAS
jgi:hypothetical protein